MLIKTVRVTNPNNVLVQIPGFIVSTWGLELDDLLEVDFDETTEQVTIRPYIHGRTGVSERCVRLAATTKA